MAAQHGKKPAASNGSRRRVRQDVPDSSLWFSDSEIGSASRRAPIAYGPEDFRRELARIERRMSRITAISIIVGILAVAVIVWVVLQTLGWRPF